MENNSDPTPNTPGTENSSEESKRSRLQQIAGLIFLALGLIGLLVAVTFGKAVHLCDDGGVPAASILFLMVGMAFFFPDLLQGPDGGFSTMRLVVFMVVAVFCVLSVKIGWLTRSFDEFRLDSTWVYILGLAFGSKVFQTFGEK